MMKKCLAVAVLGGLIVGLCTPVWAGKWLTSSDNFSKAATYGINFATYSAEKKDLEQATAKLAGMDVLFDALGKGEEILLNGDPAAFANFKDDVLKVKLVMDKVAAVATAVGGGKYDEAAIAAVDAVVGTVNHPVVNVAWEAVKLTYESHKLVQSTGAALDIERLYFAVDKDRRLLGSGGGEEPPQITVDSESVTYFYNKYLITDAATRDLVRSYVKTKLGEDFPEISTGESMWAWMTGTTEAVETEHELSQLQEFENTARRWIRELLVDVNVQARKRWSQTRLRQQTAELRAFMACYARACGSAEDTFKYYQRKKRIEKEKANFPAALAQMRRALAEGVRAFHAVDSRPKLSAEEKFHEKARIRRNIFDGLRPTRAYAAKCFTIGETNLLKQFERFEIECLKALDKMDKELYQETEEVAMAAMEPGHIGYVDYLTYFKGSVREYGDVLEGIGCNPPTADLTSRLEANDVDGALALVAEWTAAQEEAIREARNAFAKKFQRIFDHPPSHTTTALYRSWQKENKRIGPEEVERAIQARDSEWARARQEALASTGMLADTKLATYRENRHRLTAMLDCFRDQMDSLYEAVNANVGRLVCFHRWLHPDVHQGGRIETCEDVFDPQRTEPDKPAIAWAVEIASDNLRRNPHQGIVIHDDEVTVGSIGRSISFYSGIGATGLGRKYTGPAPDEVAAETRRLDTIQRKWQGFKKIDPAILAAYNDLAEYTSQDELRARFGTDYNHDPAFYASEAYLKLKHSKNPHWVKITDYEAWVREIDMDIRAIDTAAIRATFKDYRARWDQNEKRYMQERDRLAELRRQWDRWFARQKSKGVIVMDSGSGRYVARGNQQPAGAAGARFKLVSEPFEHYATRAELKADDSLEAARKELTGLPVYAFIRANMPNAKRLLDELFNATNIDPAPEENFIVRTDAGLRMVLKSDLAKARRLLAAFDLEEGYKTRMIAIAELIPETVVFPPLAEKDRDDFVARTRHEIGVFNEDLTLSWYEDFALGQEFIRLRNEIQDLIVAKGRLIQKDFSDQWLNEAALQRLDGYRQELENIRSALTGLDDPEEIHALYQQYWDLRTRYTNDTAAADPAFTAELMAFDKAFALKAGPDEPASPAGPPEVDADVLRQIEAFYREFRQAYEGQDEYRLVDMISDDWGAADGTTIAELEENLANMFAVFDTIAYRLSGLQVQRAAGGEFRVNYELCISGEIFESGITHEERSTVREVLTRNDRGEFVVERTLQGKFWR